MRKVFFLLVLFIFSGTLALEANFAFYPRMLEPVVSRLLAFPEAKALLEEIQKEGNIGIQCFKDPGATSKAYWSGAERTIFLNLSQIHSEGDKIGSILFEMSNALANHKFIAMNEKAWKRNITKAKYVESIERIEHANALKVMRMLERAVRQGYFPATAHWKFFHKFEDHYRIQQRYGHSAYIAKTYDCLVYRRA